MMYYTLGTSKAGINVGKEDGDCGTWIRRRIKIVIRSLSIAVSSVPLSFNIVPNLRSGTSCLWLLILVIHIIANKIGQLVVCRGRQMRANTKIRLSG